MDEFRKFGQILNYIKKYYYVKDGVFFNRYNEHEYGNDIIRELPKIFSVNREDCIEIFKKWAESHGVEYLDVDAYSPHRLNSYWSPDFADEMNNHYVMGVYVANEVISMLSEQIAAEIDAQILLDLKGQLNSNEFLGVVKCIGYEKGPMIYDPMTFSPRNYFTSMKKDEVLYERESNPHWQNWIQSRR